MATLGELLFYIATQNEGSHRSGSGHDNSAKDAKSSVFYYSYANYSSVR
jgi:serine/threonine-protein kinase ULK4